jgi:hypothetical protein
MLVIQLTTSQEYAGLMDARGAALVVKTGVADMVWSGRALSRCVAKREADRRTGNARLVAMGNMGNGDDGNHSTRRDLFLGGSHFRAVPLRSSDHGKEGLEAGHPRSPGPGPSLAIAESEKREERRTHMDPPNDGSTDHPDGWASPWMEVSPGVQKNGGAAKASHWGLN